MSPPSAAEPVVFVVNGDEATRRWIEATVTAAGLRAFAFETRAGLVSHGTASVIGCAILDVSLPDGSGFELQADLARAGISTLFVTRDPCISSCVRAVRAGAVDFLTLPCDAALLVQALQDALSQAISSRSLRAQIDELRSKYAQLTRREREVFALVSTGLRNKQIAHQLNISQITVQIHRSHVMRKMAARSFASFIRMADALQPLTPAGRESPPLDARAWDGCDRPATAGSERNFCAHRAPQCRDTAR